MIIPVPHMDRLCRFVFVELPKERSGTQLGVAEERIAFVARHELVDEAQKQDMARLLASGYSIRRSIRRLERQRGRLRTDPVYEAPVPPPLLPPRPAA